MDGRADMKSQLVATLHTAADNPDIDIDVLHPWGAAAVRSERHSYQRLAEIQRAAWAKASGPAPEVGPPQLFRRTHDAEPSDHVTFGGRALHEERGLDDSDQITSLVEWLGSNDQDIFSKLQGPLVLGPVLAEVQPTSAHIRRRVLGIVHISELITAAWCRRRSRQTAQPARDTASNTSALHEELPEQGARWRPCREAQELVGLPPEDLQLHGGARGEGALALERPKTCSSYHASVARAISLPWPPPTPKWPPQ
mmetsp:Transcript_53783/g.139067  ORF Transcript_53783/g.139067 Transcript_53783/m.139067 type:complete len:254 (+) Transcript_53783:218-979(+)